MNEELRDDENICIGHVPFILHGTFNPNEPVSVRLGRKFKVVVNADSFGNWLVDLGEFFGKYKFVYINGVRYGIDWNNGLKRVGKEGLK